MPAQSNQSNSPSAAHNETSGRLAVRDEVEAIGMGYAIAQLQIVEPHGTICYYWFE